MLEDKVEDCIANINYWAMYEKTKTLDRKINRIFGEFIYDPLSRVSPMERADQIREALASNEMLSEIGMPVPEHRQLEGDCRYMLGQLAERIEAVGPLSPLFQDINRLTEDHQKRLRIFLEPLGETSTLSDAINRFEEKVLPGLDDFKVRMDAVSLIRYALWFDTDKIEIHSMVTKEVTDSVLREYLRNIAWKIMDIY